MQPLRTKKNHTTSWDKKNHAISRDNKNDATSRDKKKSSNLSGQKNDATGQKNGIQFVQMGPNRLE